MSYLKRVQKYTVGYGCTLASRWSVFWGLDKRGLKSEGQKGFDKLSQLEVVSERQ